MKEQKDQIRGIGGAAAMLAAGLLCVSGATARAGSKPSAPASHPAPHASAPASHAPAARPSGGGMAGHPGGGAVGHAGPAAGGAHAGPTANGAHGGPSANAGHAGPMAGGAHGGPAAGGAGGHGAMTANNARPGAGGGNMAGHGGAAPHGTMASHSAINRPVPHGATEHVARNGSAIRTRPGGHISDVHDARRGMDIHHGLDGGRRVEMRRHDGSRLVAERGRRGFVERGYHYRGHDFARRSYYWHGHEYPRYYRGYYYRGVYMNVYAPAYYYRPAFYGWAYNPWAVPVAYAGWGWAGTPWFGFYGGYFTPYPTYASPAFWLTDYVIAQNLEAAYAARQEADAAAAAGAAAQQAVLSAEVKQQIADEVKAQIALENQEATQTAANQDVDPGSSGVARLMADGHPHVFVVGTGLDLTDANGQECAVSEGDALALRTAPAGDATSADLVVLASKGGKECASGGTVSVNVSDLQEMQNHLRETIDQGLQELQAKQGKGGLPAAPASAQAKPTESPYAAVAPPPSPDDEKDIQAQAQQADAAESEVAKEASADDGGAAPIATPAEDQPAKAPVTVALGQTTDQVKAILGNPLKTADLGSKTIYYYDGMKVVFKSGKVSDVE